MLDVTLYLKMLSETNGPSGREGESMDLAYDFLHAVMDQVERDSFGNVVGIRRCGLPDAKKVVLDAHVDEVGLVITGAEEGFLTFRSVGGIDPRMLPNQVVTILTKPTPILGVVAVLPPHIQKPGDGDKSIPIADLRIDAGLTQEEGETLVGTFCVPKSSFTALQNGMVSGKALDDRAGVVTLLRAAELLKREYLDVDLILLLSSREETGGQGAKAASFGIRPDCFVAVDVTHAKTPDGPKDETFPSGKGPVIGVGPNVTRWMSDRLLYQALANRIPYQIEVMAGHSGTNAWGVQTAREGIPTAVVSLPLKYMHSPVETLDLHDVETTARLLAHFVRGLGKEGVL